MTILQDVFDFVKVSTLHWFLNWLIQNIILMLLSLLVSMINQVLGDEYKI